jgi:hypothetical protein
MLPSSRGHRLKCLLGSIEFGEIQVAFDDFPVADQLNFRCTTVVRVMLPFDFADVVVPSTTEKPMQ